MVAFPLLRSFKKKARPNFVILGAQKAGTTTLHHFLTQHPNVRLARGKKEVHFFDRNFVHGETWYLDHFPYERELRGMKFRPVVGEKTPYYLIHPLAPERAKHVLPDAKLIVLLRDPAKRAVSHYFHSLRKGYETLDMKAALDAEPERIAGELERLVSDPSYVSERHLRFSYYTRGLYREQIDRWLLHFSRDRFLFLRSEELLASPGCTFDKVCEFLGVPSIVLPEYRQINTGTYREFSPDLLAALRERFQEPNRRLAQLLGPGFDFNVQSPSKMTEFSGQVPLVPI